MYIPYSTHWGVGKRKKPLQIWSLISFVLNQSLKFGRFSICHLSLKLTLRIIRKNFNSLIFFQSNAIFDAVLAYLLVMYNIGYGLIIYFCYRIHRFVKQNMLSSSNAGRLHLQLTRLLISMVC